MVMYPAETWKHSFVPTLVGHSILNKLVLLGAVLVLRDVCLRGVRVLELVPVGAVGPAAAKLANFR